jgi:YceI-like domain
MPIPPGTYSFGPENGTLAVRTGRTGKAAKAGHDLLLHVTSWHASLEVGEGSAPVSLALEADATSLRVIEGTGGIKALGDDDKADIQQTIDDEILKQQAIEFHSTSVQEHEGTLAVEGELTLGGTTRPLAVEVAVDGGDSLSGSVVVRQTEWGVAPYSTLFGALKVADEVQVSFDGQLTAS